MKVTTTSLTSNLLANSKAAMLAAIEIHNKPIFQYRYEVCVLLVINAWELLLKAYINHYLPEVKLIDKDNRTKPFLECLSCVESNLGNDFKQSKESVETLYEYRNGIAHFYQEELEMIIYSILRPNIIFYNQFLSQYFQIDLSKDINLVILPVSFQKPFSPVDFLTNKSSIAGASPEVVRFIESIVNSAKRLDAEGIEESIVSDYRMHLINENRIKNADIIAGISNSPEVERVLNITTILSNFVPSNNPDAKVVRLSEEEMKKVYPHNYDKVVRISKSIFSNFLKNNNFHKIMKSIKGNNKFHSLRFLDPGNPKSQTKDFYSWAIYSELANYYTLTEDVDIEQIHNDRRFI